MRMPNDVLASVPSVSPGVVPAEFEQFYQGHLCHDCQGHESHATCSNADDTCLFQRTSSQGIIKMLVLGLVRRSCFACWHCCQLVSSFISKR